MKKNTQFTNGFTLVELLISMGIMTILLTILTQVFGSILSLRQKNEAVSGIAQDSRYLLLRLSYDFKRASSITTPAVGQQSDNLVLTISGQSYRYSLNNGSLNLAINGGTPEKLNSTATAVSAVNFSRNNDVSGEQNLSLDMTLVSLKNTLGSDSSERRLQTTLSTR